MSGAYSVVVSGEIADGFDLAQVKGNVAALFKLNDLQLEKIFSGKPVSIRRGVEKEQALKLRSALTKAGAVSAIKRMQQKSAPQEKSAEPEKVVPAAVSKQAASSFSPDINCPRCGQTQSFSQACSMCKMDFTLHIERIKRKEKMREFRMHNKG